MTTQYQVVIQYVEGYYTPISLPIDSLDETIKLRESYGTRESYQKGTFFIAKITSQVMTEEEIVKEK